MTETRAAGAQIARMSLASTDKIFLNVFSKQPYNCRSGEIDNYELGIWELDNEDWRD
jgi:hypothetical protein